jgi:hypothetical protein
MSHPLDTLEWPVRTGRLLLRRATRDDLDATWTFRRLPEVHDWLGAATATYDAYRERYFREKRLADMLIVELDGRVIGDLMAGPRRRSLIRRSASRGSSAGRSILPLAARGTRPRRCGP